MLHSEFLKPQEIALLGKALGPPQQLSMLAVLTGTAL